jgi:hypothetical protein
MSTGVTINEQDVSRIPTVLEYHAAKEKERGEVGPEPWRVETCRTFSLGPPTSPFQPHLVSLALWRETP